MIRLATTRLEVPNLLLPHTLLYRYGNSLIRLQIGSVLEDDCNPLARYLNFLRAVEYSGSRSKLES